jgi:zinc protease
VTRGLGQLAAGKPPAATLDAVKVNGRHVTIVQKDGPATAISFGFPIAVRRGSREFYALWLANSWLGEHRNSASHLFQVIREARGMNYGDYSYIEAFPDGGTRIMPPTGVGRQRQIFEVWIRPVPEAQAHFALRAAMREVENLVMNGLTKQQFEDTRNFLSKYVLHYAETTSRRLAYQLDDRYYGLDAGGQPGAGDGHLARARKVLKELTLEEVNAAVKQHLRPADLWIAIVTQHAEELKQALASEAPSPMTYPAGADKHAALLEEDKIIATWPLGLLGERIGIVPVAKMFE